MACQQIVHAVGAVSHSDAAVDRHVEGSLVPFDVSPVFMLHESPLQTEGEFFQSQVAG